MIMAFRVTCGNMNKENPDVYPSQKMYPGSAQKYPGSSVKKQALIERRNVMPHQLFATPMKNESIKMNIQQNAENSEKAPADSYDSANLDLIEYFDYDRPCCKEPFQSDEMIWSKMNLMDDSFLNKVIREEGYVSDSGIDDDDITVYLHEYESEYENFGNDDFDVGNVFSAHESELELDELDIPKLPEDFDIM